MGSPRRSRNAVMRDGGADHDTPILARFRYVVITTDVTRNRSRVSVASDGTRFRPARRLRSGGSDGAFLNEKLFLGTYPTVTLAPNILAWAGGTRACILSLTAPNPP